MTQQIKVIFRILKEIKYVIFYYYFLLCLNIKMKVVFMLHKLNVLYIQPNLNSLGARKVFYLIKIKQNYFI